MKIVCGKYTYSYAAVVECCNKFDEEENPCKDLVRLEYAYIGVMII